ncbi:hypothetical protein DV738_g1031, partial [Chaetothyriales sp. CBS 135597]
MESDSKFPKYLDGDVGITVTMSRMYQLHSSVLRRYSPFFAELLVNPPRLTAKARHDHLPAFRLELVGAGPQNVGRFVRKRVTESGRVADSNPMDLLGMDASRHAEQQARYWDWLFLSFYGKAPEFDDTNLATVLQGCMGLVDVAESVGTVDHVREIVDLALLRQDDVLWQSIAVNPPAWAELGRRVHSPTIFREGVTHLVGKWQTLDPAAKASLHEDTRRLCERKAAELELGKEAIEMRILGHYPTFLCREASDRPGRPSYANDIYMWMCVAFFRQWFAQAISDGRTRKAPDGGYEFYQLLDRAGQAYLHHYDFQHFHRYFPMSSKACNVLEANMRVLKQDIRHFVSDLLRVRVHVNQLEHKINWLTCTVVDKEDLPWYVPDPAAIAPSPSLSPSTTDTATVTTDRAATNDDDDDIDIMDTDTGSLVNGASGLQICYFLLLQLLLS